MLRLLKVFLVVAAMQGVLFVAAGDASAQCNWKGPYTVLRLGIMSGGSMAGTFRLLGSTTAVTLNYSSADGATYVNLPYMKETLATLLTAKAVGSSVNLCITTANSALFSSAVIRED